MPIADNLARVRERIADAAVAAGRAPESVTLVAVSKTHPAHVVLEAAAAGQREFGENRADEALAKMAECDARGATAPATTSLRWHMVGHVQSRKAKDVAGRFDLIHSVDSVKLAKRLNEFSAASARTSDILLECNVSGEASKDGFALADWQTEPATFTAFSREVELILALPFARVRGLMTMAPIGADASATRACFASLRALREALRERFPLADLGHLSMGMTDDFELAIAEGATLVRVGRAIFGEREG